MKHLNLEYIQKLVRKHSKADEFMVHGCENDSLSIRYHNNRINREYISGKEIELQITSFFGAKSATATVSSADEEDVAGCIKLSEDLAMSAPDDPEYVPQPDSEDYSFLKDFSEDIKLQDSLESLKKVFERVSSKKLECAGSLKSEQNTMFILNSKNLCHRWDSGFHNFNITVKTDSSTGWAESNCVSYDELDIGGATGRAIDKAVLGKKPAAAAPGKYTVILEAPALGEVLVFIFRHLFEKDVDKGISAFAGKSNTTVSNKEISLKSVTGDKYKYHPWSPEGVPAGNIEFIKSGVLKEFYRNRFYAEKKNKAPTFSGNLVLEGEKEREKSIDEIIKDTDSGILVTRFWYTRPVEPRDILLTGMTRDGLYKIEDGKIAGSIKNFRFNESLLNILNNIDLYTSPKCASSYGNFEIACPDVRVKNFTFSSGTEF